MEILFFIFFFAILGLIVKRAVITPITSSSKISKSTQKPTSRNATPAKKPRRTAEVMQGRKARKMLKSENDMNRHRRSDWGERHRPFSLRTLFAGWPLQYYVFAGVILLFLFSAFLR